MPEALRVVDRPVFRPLTVRHVGVNGLDSSNPSYGNALIFKTQSAALRSFEYPR